MSETVRSRSTGTVDLERNTFKTMKLIGKARENRGNCGPY